MAVFPQARELKLIDSSVPDIEGPTQVLLRIREVGVCGTDREIASFEYGQTPPGSDHLVLGHEAVAEVAAVGTGVAGLRAGDLVVPMVRRPCPHARCIPCRSGRQDFCVTGDFTERGINGLDGFMTEYLVDDEAFLVKVPPALADVAVLVEPLTIAAKAGQELAAIRDRTPFEQAQYRAVVLGSGAVGLLGAMALVAAGAETHVLARKPGGTERSRLIESFGGHYISSMDVPADQLAQHLGDIDIIFEAIGNSVTTFEALRALGPNGTFIMSGVPALGGKHEIDTDALMRDLVLKNQLVLGTVNAARGVYQAAIQALARFMSLFPDSVRRLITRRVPLREAPATIKARGGIKEVVAVSGA